MWWHYCIYNCVQCCWLLWNLNWLYTAALGCVPALCNVITQLYLMWYEHFMKTCGKSYMSNVSITRQHCLRMCVCITERGGTGGWRIVHYTFIHSFVPLSCAMRRFLAVLGSFFHSCLLYNLSIHPFPPVSLPSSLTSACHLFFGLPLSLVSKFIYEGWNFNSGNYLFTTDTK